MHNRISAALVVIALSSAAGHVRSLALRVGTGERDMPAGPMVGQDGNGSWSIRILALIERCLALVVDVDAERDGVPRFDRQTFLLRHTSAQ